MQTLTFTRKEMAELLLSINKQSARSPLSIIQETWRSHIQREKDQGISMSAFVSTALPPVMERMIKSDMNPALSLHDIVSLGSQIEYTHFSATSVQNWVKRDFKDFIGLAEEGKKYSLQQASLFFIIEDLRSALDYEAIRKLFEIVFPVTGTDGRHPQLLCPLNFYAAYAELFEELDGHYRAYEGERNDLISKWDQMIGKLTGEFVAGLPGFAEEQRDALQNALHVALISVHTSCFHSLARRYLNGMVFMNTLK
ncbi:DUF1836 domain-containing protein [Paenibacillus nasutitermitis]|uniref:DUF1836 domain-containing protein n=1 Tax=Paenibacillus nasutitermitis TaxID=1652958 RepID=A0A916ZAK4_9BACL|nr:DUF1836 domain-containing protein [Paenibacillus nasutitermitis]GGD84464.1 hypothetical protein GCM10010911_48470 [Paenibacillus nasutitermitis]